MNKQDDIGKKMIEKLEETNYINKEEILDCIMKLKDLYDMGAISQEEFDSKKAELISKI